MIQHDYYEELCALAIAGQIEPDQMKSLKEHMETCADCQTTFADFGDIAGHVLEFAGKGVSLDPPSGMTARFVARAHSEGIPLSKRGDEDEPGKKSLRNYALALAAGLILFAGIKILLTELRSVKTARTTLEAPNPAASASSSRVDLLRENANLAQQLEVTRKQVRQLTDEVKAEQRDLESVRAEKVLASARVVKLEKANTDLGRDLAARDSQVARLNGEADRNKVRLDELASAKTIDEVQIEAHQSELNNLRAQVASLTEELSERQQLSAAAEQAKDLIVARHLHIVDVDDTDGTGKQQRPFGRIFYTEGRSLVFYAYDLADPRKLNTKITFYVWGGQEGINKPVRSLGIFHADDVHDGRWVLRFDDPNILAAINCVFVTAESNKKPVSQPTGHQILFASLGARPNHP